MTSGQLRGFRVEVPRSVSVRPPLEMLREAVFNILGQDLEGWRVADLFAGSGIMGIEALSRGADQAVFLEKDRAATAVILRNLEKTRLLDRGTVITGNAFGAARRLGGKGPIDAVFMDPPFALLRHAAGRARLLELAEELFTCGELAADALAILRTPERTVLDIPEGLRVQVERKYGHSRLFFLSKNMQAAGAQEKADSQAPGSNDEDAR